MKIIDLNSWEEFLAELNGLQQAFEFRRAATGLHVDDPLFRGQSNHKWFLETTLERYGFRNLAMHEYYLSVLRSRPAIQTYTNKSWTIDEIDAYKNFLRFTDSFMFSTFPGYEYFVYLRHHSYPSPLLDWSSSPFVASYFAFNDADESNSANRVSIYAYCEFFGAGKITQPGLPTIQTKGPYVVSHPRHFKQQSSYSFCTARSSSGEWEYVPHEDAFTSAGDDQDMLWKFTVPSSEKRKVIQYLEKHNLNAYSLFNSEESLMSTMATRELYLRLQAT